MKKICKNLLKIIIAVILVALIVIVALKAYSQKIVFDILDSMENYSKGEFTLRETENITIQETSEQKCYISDYIKTEDVYVNKNNYGDCIYVEWLDLKNVNGFYNFCYYNIDNDLNSKNTIMYETKTFDETQYKMKYSIPQIYTADIREYLEISDKLSFVEKINTIASLPIVYTQNYEGKECYVFGDISWGKTYIEKESLLPLATISENYFKKFEYNFEYDKKLLEEPEVSEFTNTIYTDTFNEHRSGLIKYDEYSENSISGTTLNPKDTLVETVKLKENETLNVLPILADSYGIKRVDIDSLELYNRLRAKYSNLRELTEEDLMYYSATIIYKEGYELSYVETKEKVDAFYGHYIFSEKQSEDDSIVLIMKPRARYGGMKMVISNEKLEFPVDQVLATYFSISNEIEENLGLDKDILYCANADIDILKNEEYKKFDYVKTPIDDIAEPICWKIKADINIRDKNYGEVYTYINAITGEVIGSRYIRNNN